MVLGASGCTADSNGTPGGERAPTASADSSPPGGERWPREAEYPDAWKPSRNDVRPDIKQVAVRFVEEVLTWQGGTPSDESVKRRVGATGYAAAEAAGLLGGAVGTAEASAVRVNIAQYGGLLETTSSVLVAFDLWQRQPAGQVRRTGGTWDVRLADFGSGQWNVTTVRQGNTPPKQPSTFTTRLAKSEQLQLPVAAEADIVSGAIATNVLAGLRELSMARRLGVSVVKSGHPIRVFGTGRTSDHTKGKAVDIWSIDGRRVVDLGDDTLVRKLMTDALAAGAYQVGGPIDLGEAFFSDDTHRDHVHIGFP